MFRNEYLLCIVAVEYFLQHSLVRLHNSCFARLVQVYQGVGSRLACDVCSLLVPIRNWVVRTISISVEGNKNNLNQKVKVAFFDISSWGQDFFRG